jgi:hypothetical protein
MGLVWELALPHNHAWILMCLADHADHQGRNVYPGVELIAWKTGYTPRHVKRILHELEEAKIIVPTSRGGGRGKVRKYRLDLDRVPRKAVAPSPGSRKRTAGRKGDRMSPIPTSENSDGMSPNPATKKGDEMSPIRPGEKGVKASPIGSGKGDIQGTERVTSDVARVVNQLPETSIPPVADAPTPQGGERLIVDGDFDADRDEAQKRMRILADKHPYLGLFSGSRKSAMQATTEKFILAEGVAHVWTDADGNPVPWEMRPDVLSLALDVMVASPTGTLLQDAIRRVAIPKLLDPFPIRRADAPKPGTEAAAVRSETPGRFRSDTGTTGGLEPIAKEPPALPPDPNQAQLEDWIASHQEEAQKIMESIAKRRGGGAASSRIRQAWIAGEFRAEVLKRAGLAA